MQKHVKVYFDYYGYGEEDLIFCEVCSAKAVDIAHIKARSTFGSKRKEEQDNISNLISLCRSCHYKYDFENKITQEDLQEIHNLNLKK
jgi:predicted restriction endonuclease